MLSHIDAEKVGIYFYQIDRKCRDDFSKGMIISERDYVSRFTTFAMYPYGPFIKSPIFWISQTLPQPIETKFGCDGVIVFRKGNLAKIGMFEAKWPRMDPTRCRTPWDDKKPKELHSRLSKELQKQNPISSKVAIWEMFFNDLNVGVSKKDGFNSEVSACIWHDLAYYYWHKRIRGTGKVWYNRKESHLRTMLRYRKMLKSAINIKDILIEILTCNKGIPFNIKTKKDDTYAFIELNNIEIPLPDQNYGNSEDITDFMKDNGFRQYAFIDLEDLLSFLNDKH
ncbi:hypothetical protein ACLM5H_16840 [Fredinandcohnia humi]